RGDVDARDAAPRSRGGSRGRDGARARRAGMAAPHRRFQGRRQGNGGAPLAEFSRPLTVRAANARADGRDSGREPMSDHYMIRMFLRFLVFSEDTENPCDAPFSE